MRINFWKKEAEPAFFQESDLDQSGLPVESVLPVEEYVEMSQTAKTYNSVASWIITVGAFLLPLFFLPVTTGVLELNKQILLVAVAGASLITWLLGVVISGQLSLRSNVIDRGVAGMLLATVGASIFSLSRSISIFGLSSGNSESLVSVLALSVLYFVSTNVFEDKGKRLLVALSLSSLVALLFGLAQMLTLFIFSSAVAHSRAFNTVGSVNALGLLAALSLPIFSKLKIQIKGNKFLDVSKLGLVASIAVLVVLNWWVLWTAAIVGMLAITALDSFAAAKGHQGQTWKISRFLLPMTVIVLGVFLMIVKFSFTPIRGNLPVEVSPSYTLSGRVASAALRDRLVFGYGPENYSLAFDKYGAKSLTNTTLSNIKFFDATAQIFGWAVNGGVVMLVAFVFLLWSLVSAFLKSRQNEEAFGSPEFSATVATLAAGVAILFIYPLNLTLTSVIYLALAVFVLRVWGERSKVMNIEDKPLISLASSVGFIVGLILVLAGSYFVALRYIGDIDYGKASASQDNGEAVQLLVNAINWNNQDDRYYRAISQATLSLLNTEINSKPDPKDTQRQSRVTNYIQSAISFARQATDVGPLEAENWYNLGVVYQALIGLVDNVDQLAEDSYLKAADLRPGDASFFNRAGSMHLARSDLFRQLSRSAGSNGPKLIQEANRSLGRAEELFKLAIEKSSNFGLAIYNLGAVYDRQGKTAEAIKQIERIIPSNANQPSLFFELGLLYYRVGRKADSLASFNQAVLLAPQYANARWYLALILEENKDYAGAISQMEKILENNTDNQTVINKIAELKAGQYSIPPEKVIDQPPLGGQ